MRTFVNATSRIYNGAKSRQYRVDIDLTAAVSNRLSFASAIELMHDRFVSFPAAVISSVQSNGSNTQVPGVGHRQPVAVHLGLDSLDRCPLRAAGGQRHRHVHGDFTYNDGYFSEPDNVLRQPRFGLLNSSVVWDSDAGYAVSIWGRT